MLREFLIWNHWSYVFLSWPSKNFGSCGHGFNFHPKLERPAAKPREFVFRVVVMHQLQYCNAECRSWHLLCLFFSLEWWHFSYLIFLIRMLLNVYRINRFVFSFCTNHMRTMYLLSIYVCARSPIEYVNISDNIWKLKYVHLGTYLYTCNMCVCILIYLYRCV